MRQFMPETFDEKEVRVSEPVGKDLPMGHWIHRIGRPVHDHGRHSDQGELIESIGMYLRKGSWILVLTIQQK